MIRRVLEVLNQYQVVSQKLNVFQVLNLFEPLVDRHCKVVSHQFDVFRKFQISFKPPHIYIVHTQLWQ